MKYELIVPDMSCEHCKMRISKAFSNLGLRDFGVYLEEKKVVVDTDDIETVLETLKDIGYPVSKYGEL